MENQRGRWEGIPMSIRAALACAVLGAGAAACSNSTPSLTGVGGSGGHAGAGGTVGDAGVGGAGVDGGVDATTADGGPSPVCTVPAATPGTWAEITPPPGQDGLRVTDAFAAAPNDLFFAGVTSDHANPRILRWAAGCWTVELTIPTTTRTLTPSVNGASGSDVWAAGGDRLYHRDAQGWTPFADDSWRNMVHQPPTFAGPLELVRVRATAPNQIWVAASNNLLRWDGQAWTAFNFDDPTYPASGTIAYYFKDIWIDSATSVWVGSASDGIGNTMNMGFMHHFDGANWTHTAVGVGAVQSIWHAGNVYWLATPTIDIVNGQQVSRTLRAFNGFSAPSVPVTGIAPTQSTYLLTLFGRGASDVWAAGADVAHFDGQSWSLVTDAPAPARSSNDDGNTFVTGDAASVWLSTPGPRFFRRGD